MTGTVSLRRAELSDQAGIRSIIEQSCRTLARDDYLPEQIEAALKNAWGLDTQLINDGTYYVALDAQTLAGCGGWSYRQTLFGGDAEPNRNAATIDPRYGAAKIRAFFVHPDYARQGIGSLILARCEEDARRHGYRRFELMATLPGERLYRRFGYQSSEPIAYPLCDDLTIRFVPMTKVHGDAADD